MRTRFLQSVLPFGIILSLCFPSGCLDPGALPFSMPAIDSDETRTESDPLGSTDGGGDSIPFPDPFETHPQDPRGEPMDPPYADAGEPSVFSTQIGEGHTPERPEYLCAIEIYLPLAEIARDHDFECIFSLFLWLGVTPPRVTLSSSDVGFEFTQIYPALCDQKGWEVNILAESFFTYDYSISYQIPRRFELKVEILKDGVWEEVRLYKLEFECPWPPPPEPPIEPPIECLTEECDKPEIP